MTKSFFLGLFCGLFIASVAIIEYYPNIVEALYSIPPTTAYNNLTIIDPIAWPNETQTSIQAINYRDIQYWTSDGSIEFNFTTFP